MIELSQRVSIFALALLFTVGAAHAQQDLRVGLMDAEPGVVRINDQLGGRDIDVWGAIAKNCGFRVRYVFVNNPPALLTALDEGKVDVAGWTTTTDAKYLLTDMILPSAEALVVPSTDARMYRGVDEIKGLSFATLKGTAYSAYLKKIGVANIKEFDALPEVLKSVVSGEVKAAMFSGIIAGFMGKQGKLPGLQVVTAYQPALSRPVVAAFPKAANENYSKANACLKKLHEDGTMANIKTKYGL